MASLMANVSRYMNLYKGRHPINILTALTGATRPPEAPPCPLLSTRGMTIEHDREPQGRYPRRGRPGGNERGSGKLTAGCAPARATGPGEGAIPVKETRRKCPKHGAPGHARPALETALHRSAPGAMGVNFTVFVFAVAYITPWRR